MLNATPVQAYRQVNSPGHPMQGGHLQGSRAASCLHHPIHQHSCRRLHAQMGTLQEEVGELSARLVVLQVKGGLLYDPQ